jgi:hypothetical protein
MLMKLEQGTTKNPQDNQIYHAGKSFQSCSTEAIMPDIIEFVK